MYRVVVADSNLPMQELYKQMLTRHFDVEVTVFGDDPTLLDYLTHYQPHLLVLDTALIDYQAIIQAAAAHNTKVLLATSKYFPDDSLEAQCVDHFFEKPVQMAYFTSCVKALID